MDIVKNIVERDSSGMKGISKRTNSEDMRERKDLVGKI